MKEHYLLSTALVFGLLFASCKSHSTEDSKVPVIDTRAQKGPFEVIELPTEDASAEDPDDPEVKGFKYPASTNLDLPVDLKGRINVYGASYQLWPAPANWTGNGNIFTNGGMCVHFHPVGDDALSGAFIHYSEERRDQSSILVDAAPYFKDALEEYNATMNEDQKNPVKSIPGIKISTVSETLVTYTLPPANGLLVKGIVVYGVDDDNNEDPFFAEMKFAFPAGESKTLDFLMRYYIKKMQE